MPQKQTRFHAAPDNAQGGNQPQQSTQDAPQSEQPPQGQQGGGGQNQQPPADDRKPKSKKPLIILALVVITLAIVAFVWNFVTRNDVATDDAYTEGNVVTIAPKISGYVVQLNIDDNSFVHAGDVLLQIDPRDYVNARDTAAANLKLAQAQLLSAKANYEIARIRYPAQLQQAQAQKAQSQATEFQAEQEYKRQHSVNSRATTQENIDTATAQQRSAAAQVSQTDAQIEVAKPISQYLAQADATVKQQEAQVEQMQAQLDQAQLNLDWTTMRAPQDGWVTRRNVQLGSYLQSGQSIFELVTRTVWIIANFKETQLDRMRIGQRVDITIDAYPGLELHGHVDTVQLGSGSRFSAFPAENATGNFVKIVQRVPVKIVLDSNNPPGGGKNDWPMLPIGLSAEPIVRLGTEPDKNAGRLNAFQDFRKVPTNPTPVAH